MSCVTGTPGRSLSHFDSSDVGNTTTLLLSDDGDTLFVGARNAVLSLDVSQEDAIVMRSKVGRLTFLPLTFTPV